jgi:hypothetical protein
MSMQLVQLSRAQSDTLAQLRLWQPTADMRLYGKPGGVLVELRRGHNSQVAFINDAGTFVPDVSLRPGR